MGCGCKNKGNETPQAQQTSQTQNQPNTQTTQQTNSVQEAIKKTIEKYYTVKKG